MASRGNCQAAGVKKPGPKYRPRSLLYVSCARRLLRRMRVRMLALRHLDDGLATRRLLLDHGVTGNHLELDTAVLGAAFGGLVIGDRPGLAVTLRGQVRLGDALADEIGDDRLRTTLRQLQVVRRRTDCVGMT